MHVWSIVNTISRACALVCSCYMLANAASLPLVFERRGQDLYVARAGEGSFAFSARAMRFSTPTGTAEVEFGGVAHLQASDPEGAAHYFGPSVKVSVPQFGKLEYEQIYRGVDLL